jgi:NAD(P)-dependent dehydrogenase (short-subunit alcohol dehydrogenase family)
VTHLAARAVELGGQVDVLVNNAGLFPIALTPEVTASEFETVDAVNVRAPFFLVAALSPAMAERGYGAIVNVTTMWRPSGWPGSAASGARRPGQYLATSSSLLSSSRPRRTETTSVTSATSVQGRYHTAPSRR